MCDGNTRTLEHGVVAPSCACLALGNKVYNRNFKSCIGVKHVFHVRRGGCHPLIITFRISDTVSLELVAVSQHSSQSLHNLLYVCGLSCGLSCAWFKRRVGLCCFLLTIYACTSVAPILHECIGMGSTGVV